MRAALRIALVVLSFTIVFGVRDRATQAQFSKTTGNATNTMSAAASFYRAVVVADGPTAYWRLGETSGTTATDVMGVANGTYGGFYTLGVAGALVNDTDKSFDTSGAGVLITNTAPLRPTTAVTVEAWVRPDALTPIRWIWNINLNYYLYIDNGTTIFGIRTVPANYLFASSTTVTTGSWQHLVGTYDGSKITLYRNGVQVGQTNATGTMTTAAGDALIAAYDTLGTNWFDGRIDEVAVYTKALTAAQALDHYRRGALTQP